MGQEAYKHHAWPPMWSGSTFPVTAGAGTALGGRTGSLKGVVSEKAGGGHSSRDLAQTHHADPARKQVIRG